jgi:uncharacterized membrane protein YkoI
MISDVGGIMNRNETLAIVLGGILVISVVGGTAVSAAKTPGDAAPPDTGDALGDRVADGAQNQTISIVEAMEAAANETADRNATVVGAELGQTEGLLEFDFDGDNESVYTVDVLLANGTHVEVGVNATNGSVVQTDEEEEGFLAGIFGEDEVPDEPLNLSAMYNATEAVQLAQNETDANGTVTAVDLEEENDTLVYEVQFEGADDAQRTVVVAAMKDGDGVVDTETGDGG